MLNIQLWNKPLRSEMRASLSSKVKELKKKGKKRKEKNLQTANKHHGQRSLRFLLKWGEVETWTLITKLIIHSKDRLFIFKEYCRNNVYEVSTIFLSVKIL